MFEAADLWFSCALLEVHNLESQREFSIGFNHQDWLIKHIESRRFNDVFI